MAVTSTLRAADKPAIAEQAGPTAHGDPMGTPAKGEQVLWKGRPDRAILARSAFHSRSIAAYFGVLGIVALALGNLQGLVICLVLGAALVALCHGIAWLSARTTLYILTDTRLIMRIGMAIETRINVPLKHIEAASLKERGPSYGDIALQLGGERMLGYVLLWPHARPWRLASPQPMLRAVPEAQKVAKLLAEARAVHGAIEFNAQSADHQGSAQKGPAPQNAQPVADTARPGIAMQGAPA